MSSLLKEFVSFTEMLNQENIDYAICGGWAMAIHGLPRATVDIDLLVLTEDLEKFGMSRKTSVTMSKVCRRIFTTERLKFGGFPKLTRKRKGFLLSIFS
jgi:hypothetical protein